MQREVLFRLWFKQFWNKILILYLSHSHFNFSLCPSSDLPYDLWPCQCHGEDSEPDRYDAAAVPLGRLSAVPGPHAAGLPSWLLGFQEPDGGESPTSCPYMTVTFQHVSVSKFILNSEYKASWHSVWVQIKHYLSLFAQCAQYLFQINAN